MGYLTVFMKQICKWNAVKQMGPYALNKILYFNRTFPIRGFQIYDGPIHLTRCTFQKYVPTLDRYTSAIGFLMKNSWQITPRNNISFVKFGPHVSTFLWFLYSDYGTKWRDGTFPEKETQRWDLHWVFRLRRRILCKSNSWFQVLCPAEFRMRTEVPCDLEYFWYQQRENDLMWWSLVGIVEFHRNKRTYDFGEFSIIIHKEIWVLPGILLFWDYSSGELENKRLGKKRNTGVIGNKLGYFWYKLLEYFYEDCKKDLEITVYNIVGHRTREGDGTPLQYSCLENPMDGGAWWAAVHGVAKSWTRLCDFTFTFHFHALEKEMATHSSILAWRIPETGKPGGLPSKGSHRVRDNWSDLAAAGHRNRFLSSFTSTLLTINT